MRLVATASCLLAAGCRGSLTARAALTITSRSFPSVCGGVSAAVAPVTGGGTQMALGCENSSSSSRDSLPGSYRAKRKTATGDELESNNLETLGWRGGWGWRGVRGGIDPTLGQTLKAPRCLRQLLHIEILEFVGFHCETKTPAARRRLMRNTTSPSAAAVATLWIGYVGLHNTRTQTRRHARKGCTPR